LVAIPIGLAIVSFLIYAATIFTLPQIRDSKYCCEQSSFAAAVSNVVYGSRVGSLYTGVFDAFMDHFTDPLPDTLKKIRAELPEKPSDDTFSPTTLDGNGVGYPLVATVAFRLFGLQWWSLTAVMLILMAVSMAVFLLRFPPLLVTLYFGGLTVMLFTILVWDPGWRMQIPVGGIRYFSLTGLLPLFYILFSLIERQPSRAVVPLAIQTAILTLAALTRGNAVTAFGAIAVVGLVIARRNPTKLRDMVTIGVATAAVVAVIAFVVSPNWITSGRFHTIVWTRVTQSLLATNPNLSVAKLDEMYPCPAGETNADDGGGCIWSAYVKKHHIPIDSLGDKTFGGEFEAAMRAAFFEIAWKYPSETLQTFLYYKPAEIIDSLRVSLDFNLSEYSPLAIGLLLVALGTILSAAATARSLNREGAIILVAALFTATAYLAAYANPGVTADLLLCCLMGCGLLFGALVKALVKLARLTLFASPSGRTRTLPYS
jgi:hypothetical protein